MAQTHTVGLKIEMQGAAQVQGAVRSVGQELDKISPAAQSASAGADRLAAALGRISHYAVGGGLALIAGQVLGALTGSFAQVTGQFTDLQSRLQLTVGSASAATEAMGRLQAMARRTYSDFAGTTESFLGMSGALKELGYRTNEQLDFVESLNNALVVSGAKAERAAQVQDALSKAMALGTLQGDQLNTVISVGGRVAELLAEQLGVGVNQLRALGSQGKITGDIIYQALAGNLEKVRQEADAMPATIQDGMLLLGDAIKQTTADIDGMVGASAATAASLVGLADGVKSVGQALKDNQGIIKAVLGGALGAGSVGGILAVSRALAGAGGVAASIGVVRGAFLALSAAMAANPLGLALLGIGAVTGAVIASNSKTVAERSTAWIEKEIAHQEKRIATAQRSLDLAGGSKGGKDPMTAQLEERLAAMKAYRQELQSEVWTRQAGPTGAGGGRGSINPPTVGEMRAQQQAATSAWQASIAGVKTATSVQQDYTDKLAASRAAFSKLAETGLQGSALEQAQAQQLEYETALATERDKALKNLTAGTAQAGAAMAQANKLAVEDVQRSAAAMLGGYEDADAVLSAMRSAGLIGEQEYYQTKIGYLEAEAKIRVQALKDENTLLASQAQGKAKSLEAERQIAKNRAEIARIEQQTLTKTTVLTVEAAAKRNEEARSVEEQVLKLREEAQARELATAGNISQAQALEQLRLARLAEALAQAKSRGASAEEIAAIEREIAARKELLQVMGSDAAAQASAKAAEKAAQDWERTSKTIGDTLADYIMGGGKNAAQYLKRLFSTLVLQPVVQATVGSVLGSVGLGGAAQAGGAAGQVGGLLSGAQNISSLYSAFTGGLTSTIAGGIASLGSAFGSSALTSFAAGMKGATLASGLAGPTTAGATGAMGMGATVGAALPWVAGGIAVVGLLSKLVGGFGGGTSDYGAAALYSGERLAETGKAYTYQELTQSYAAGVQPVMDALVQTIGGTLDGLAKQYGQQSGYRVQMGYTSDNDDPSRGIFIVQNPEGEDLNKWLHYRSGEYGNRKTGYRFAKDPEKGLDDYLKAVTADTIPLIIDIVPSWADAMLEGFGKSIGLQDVLQGGKNQAWKNIANGQEAFDGLQAVLGQIQVVEAAFTALGQTMGMFSGISDQLKSDLMAALGGIESLGSVAESFYQSFYSEQERHEAGLKQMSATLATLDLSIDPRLGEAAKAQYRKTVEDAMAAGNGELAGQLLALGGAFAQLADAGEQLQKTMVQTAAQTTDDALRTLQAAVDAERKIHTARISALQEQVSAAKSLFDTLGRHIDDMRGNVMVTAQMAAVQGQRTIDQAISAYRTTGYLPEAADIGSAAEAARSGLQSQLYGSRMDFEADQLILANKLEALHGAAGKQLTADELLLAQEKAQLEQLELLFEAEKKALDIHRGNYQATLSVADAVEKLHATIAAEIALRDEGKDTEGSKPGSSGGGGHVAGPGSSSAGGSSDSAYDDYQRRAALAILGGEGAAAKQNIKDVAASYEGSGDVVGLWNAITAAGGNQYDLKQLYGWDVDDIDRALHNAGVPGFSQGINLVPQDMLARIHQGEAIVPRAYNPFNPAAATPWGSSKGDEASTAALQRIYELLYSLGRQQLELLQSMERLARKADAIGTKQRIEEAAV